MARIQFPDHAARLSGRESLYRSASPFNVRHLEAHVGYAIRSQRGRRMRSPLHQYPRPSGAPTLELRTVDRSIDVHTSSQPNRSGAFPSMPQQRRSSTYSLFSTGVESTPETRRAARVPRRLRVRLSNARGSAHRAQATAPSAREDASSPCTRSALRATPAWRFNCCSTAEGTGASSTSCRYLSVARKSNVKRNRRACAKSMSQFRSPGTARKIAMASATQRTDGSVSTLIGRSLVLPAPH